MEVEPSEQLPEPWEWRYNVKYETWAACVLTLDVDAYVEVERRAGSIWLYLSGNVADTRIVLAVLRANGALGDPKGTREEQLVAAWHNSATELELSEWLGWTEEQYAAYVERGAVPTSVEVLSASRRGDQRELQLYRDALALIANHPEVEGCRAANWMREKAEEALEKRELARSGKIYGQIGDKRTGLENEHGAQDKHK